MLPPNVWTVFFEDLGDKQIISQCNYILNIFRKKEVNEESQSTSFSYFCPIDNVLMNLVLCQLLSKIFICFYKK